VLAIVITIMVLELRIPVGSSANALRSVWPGLHCYVLSSVNVEIYWNNHHHLKTVERVTGSVLWRNLGDRPLVDTVEEPAASQG
jgi:uncharacterized membrane protein